MTYEFRPIPQGYYPETFLVEVSLDDLANDGGGGEGDNVKPDIEELIGTIARDKLTGSAGPNTLWGRGGHDELFGGDGNDVLHGEAGNDRLDGGNGDDTHNGGDDNDTLFANAGADAYNGGTGTDEANYDGRTEGLTIDIDGNADDGSATDGPAGARDNVGVDVENVVGGSGADSITGSSADNVLHGGFGADTLIGLGGNDTLFGDPEGFTYPYQPVGADSLYGGDGDDTFYALDQLAALSPGLFAAPAPKHVVRWRGARMANDGWGGKLPTKPPGTSIVTGGPARRPPIRWRGLTPRDRRMSLSKRRRPSNVPVPSEEAYAHEPTHSSPTPGRGRGGAAVVCRGPSRRGAGPRQPERPGP